MKKIGLLGGMSWESSALYYNMINKRVMEALGGLNSADILLKSYNFQEIADLHCNNKWEENGAVLAQGAKTLEAAGVDFIAICSNTMHKLAPHVEAAVNIPLLHLADPTAEAIKAAGFKHIGLLGTEFTMTQRFHIERFEAHGLTVDVPTAPEIKEIHRIIYGELCRGIITEDSRRIYLDIMNALVEGGAEAIIEGCTEIVTLVGPAHTNIPLFDTTTLHAAAIADYALS